MRNLPITVVIVDPGMPAYKCQILDTYDSFCEIVNRGVSEEDLSGYESFPDFLPNHRTYTYFVKDIGKCLNLPSNRIVRMDKSYFQHTDVTAGSFLITRFDDLGECVSLNDKECDFLISEMNRPERKAPVIENYEEHMVITTLFER